MRQQQLQDVLAERKSEEQQQELQTTQKQLETAVADYRQVLNAEIEQTRQIRFLAIALGLLSQHSQGDYQFKSRSFGKAREQIALALATEFTLQELYGDLEERIETFERDFIYHKLQEFGTSASDLNPYERKLLDHLLSDYKPLN